MGKFGRKTNTCQWQLTAGTDHCIRRWIPAHVGIPGNTLVDSKAKQGSTLPQTSVPIDLSTAKVLIRRTVQEELHAHYMHDSHSATHRTDWRDQSTGTLEIRLDQKPVHHCRSAENRSLSTSGQLPSPYRTTTVSSVPTLRRRWRNRTASSTLLPVTRAGTIIY